MESNELMILVYKDEVCIKLYNQKKIKMKKKSSRYAYLQLLTGKYHFLITTDQKNISHVDYTVLAVILISLVTDSQSIKDDGSQLFLKLMFSCNCLFAVEVKFCTNVYALSTKGKTQEGRHLRYTKVRLSTFTRLDSIKFLLKSKAILARCCVPYHLLSY